MDQLEVPCPTCGGTADHSTDDGHRDNNKDTCTTCGGRKVVPARTGEVPEASYNPKTGTTFSTPNPHGWLPIKEASHDCTLYELQVPSRHHGLRDADTSVTIGSNNGDHDGEHRWQYVGWNWEQDCYMTMDTAAGAPEPTHFREMRPDVNGKPVSDPDPASTSATDFATSRAEGMEPDLCEDEGCPHHGTPHICNVTVASDVPERVSDDVLRELFSMEDDDELTPDENGHIRTCSGAWMRDGRGWYFVKDPETD